MKQLILFFGSQLQYRQYVKNNTDPLREFKHITDLEQIRGLRFDDYIVDGSCQGKFRAEIYQLPQRWLGNKNKAQ